MPWELIGNTNTNEQTNFIGTTDKHALVIRTNGTEAVRVDASGNVGVGTKTPTAKLEVVGKLQIDAQDAIQIAGFQPFITLTDTESASVIRARIQNAGGTINFFTEASFSGGIPPMRILNTGTVQMFAQDALQITGFQPFVTLIDSENNSFVQARIQNAGGTINFFTQGSLGGGIPPMRILNTGTVQMFAQDALQITGFQPFVTLIDSENNSFARARIQNARGDLNFFTEASFASGIPPMKINNSSGNVEINGDMTLSGADCAEDFDVAGPEQIEPGTVVVINREGAMTPSREAYDKKVAGVVSGAGEYKPGMVLDRRKSTQNRKTIALLGKVYCKVDASAAPIEVGDMLTTSPTPGHAMKVDDPLRAFGAVIGKALRPLSTGRGLIPILIALQ
jgi:hypothetical protein